MPTSQTAFTAPKQSPWPPTVSAEEKRHPPLHGQPCVDHKSAKRPDTDAEQAAPLFDAELLENQYEQSQLQRHSNKLWQARAFKKCSQLTRRWHRLG